MDDIGFSGWSPSGAGDAPDDLTVGSGSGRRAAGDGRGMTQREMTERINAYMHAHGIENRSWFTRSFRTGTVGTGTGQKPFTGNATQPHDPWDCL